MYLDNLTHILVVTTTMPSGTTNIGAYYGFLEDLGNGLPKNKFVSINIAASGDVGLESFTAVSTKRTVNTLSFTNSGSYQAGIEVSIMPQSTGVKIPIQVFTLEPGYTLSYSPFSNWSISPSLLLGVDGGSP